MSTIDPRLNTNLPSGLEALDRQAQLDGGIDNPALAELADGEPLRSPAIDDGEAVLNASAWADGGHGFETDGLQARLAGSDRGSAVDQGVDDVLAGLG